MNPQEMMGFFFQAEDGIRDIGVTGVQTCALPISSRYPEATRPAPISISRRAWSHTIRRIGCARPEEGEMARNLSISAMFGLLVVAVRSEERRVGKECRSRRSPYH